MPGGEGGGPSVGPIPRKKGGREKFPRRYSRHIFGPCSGRGPRQRVSLRTLGERQKSRGGCNLTQSELSLSLQQGPGAKDWLQTMDIHVWKIVGGARECYAPRWWNLRGEMRRLAGNRWEEIEAQKIWRLDAACHSGANSKVNLLLLWCYSDQRN